MSEEELFHETLQKPPDERAAFLDEACRGDEALRRRVEVLLGAHVSPGSFLAGPAVDSHAIIDQRPAAEGPGTVVGSYKLLEQIGEGGFGVVFLAEQTEPVRRKVALKVLKPGMDTRQVIARFEAERQVLAIMDHPNIARVFDGGTTPSGRPYFVMELVKGVPITEFCDQHHLLPRQRLELFVSVCQAVQHAHQKGIIHRDLKPSNVLVSRHDTNPVVKVIDFGVAKALGQELTDKTLFTGVAQMIGTPLYMSPEQAGMSDLDVDTRSDVYSLGVLLYELLTGTTPFTRERFRVAAYDEIRRIIREEEPPKPSTRLSESNDVLPLVAAQRRTELVKLRRLVRGELDWIVMQALEKDRNRRYDTANSFALDVQRYLADQPVLAHPPSAGYRLRKFTRRNRPQVVAAGLVLLALVAGVIGTTLGLLEARRKADLAQYEAGQKETARAEEARQRGIAEANERLAEDEAYTAKEVNRILEEILSPADTRRQAKFAMSPDPGLTVRQALDRTASRIGDRLAARPRVAATVRNTLGVSYTGIGDYQQAITHLSEARRLFLTICNPSHPDVLDTDENLATAYLLAGEVNRAVQILEAVVKVRTKVDGADAPGTLIASRNLGSAVAENGDFERAVRLLDAVLATQTRLPGIDPSVPLGTMNALAVVHWRAGRIDVARDLFSETLQRRVALLTDRHPDSLTTKNNLAVMYSEVKDYNRAIALFNEILPVEVEVKGWDHPETLSTRHNLGLAYLQAGQVRRAIELYEESLRVRRVKLGPHHPQTVGAMVDLAFAHQDDGRPDRASPLLREAHEARRARLGPDAPETVTVLTILGANLLLRKLFSEAEPVLRESLAIREKKQPDSWSTYSVRSMVGESLLGQGKLPEAERLLLDGYEGMRQQDAKIPPARRPRVIEAVDRLTQLYTVWGKPAEAAKWRAERAKYPPETAPPPRQAK